MNKINNTAISSARQKAFDLVNEMLSEGMPIVIVDMILDLVSSQVKATLHNQIEQEKLAMAELFEQEQYEQVFEAQEICE
jgi:hypothetical protein